MLFWRVSKRVLSPQMGPDLVSMARASGAPNQPPKTPTMPCGVCGWYVGAHQLTTSTYFI